MVKGRTVVGLNANDYGVPSQGYYANNTYGPRRGAVDFGQGEYRAPLFKWPSNLIYSQATTLVTTTTIPSALIFVMMVVMAVKPADFSTLRPH